MTMENLHYDQEPSLHYRVNAGDVGVMGFQVTVRVCLCQAWPVALNPKGKGLHCNTPFTEGEHVPLENLCPTIPAEWVASLSFCCVSAGPAGPVAYPEKGFL